MSRCKRSDNHSCMREQCEPVAPLPSSGDGDLCARDGCKWRRDSQVHTRPHSPGGHCFEEPLPSSGDDAAASRWVGIARDAFNDGYAAGRTAAFKEAADEVADVGSNPSKSRHHNHERAFAAAVAAIHAIARTGGRQS